MEIRAQNAGVRITESNGGKSFFPLNEFRVEFKDSQNQTQEKIQIVEAGTAIRLVNIGNISDVTLIEDNRDGGPGTIAVPATLTLLYDIIEGFFFRKPLNSSDLDEFIPLAGTKQTGPVISITSVVRSGNIVTLVSAANHNLTLGKSFTVIGVTDGTFNGTFALSNVLTPTSFTYTQVAGDASSTGGTFTCDADPATGLINYASIASGLPGYGDQSIPDKETMDLAIALALVGGTRLAGDYDASTNTPDLDTSPSGIIKGDIYLVTVAGTFFTEGVDIGDTLTARQDDPTLLSQWIRLENNNAYTLSKVLGLGTTTGPNIIDHNIASGTTRQIGTGGVTEQVDSSNYYAIEVNSGGFDKGYLELHNDAATFAFGATFIDISNGKIIIRANSGVKDILIANALDGTPNVDHNNVVISNRNLSSNGGGTFFNSVFLGGTGGVINKSNYAFVNNLEVQGGVARYSSPPALATDRDFTDVGFVNGRYVSAGTYTPSNVVTTRTFDANSITLNELADVVGTIIADLQGTPQSIFQ